MLPLMLAAIVVQAAPVLPRAPVLVPPPIFVPPPIVTTRQQAPRDVFTVDVELRAGTQLVWSGPLRVATNNQTSLRHELSEPAEAGCETTPYYGGSQSRFRINLQASATAPGSNRITVNVAWTRPTEGRCPLPPGSRTIEPGRTAMITGDGGLTVRLTRR